MTRRRRTLAEMDVAANGGKPLQIAGQPAVACPYCGCAMFINGTQSLATRVDRYEVCRNSNCGRRFLTRQQQAPQKVFVKEISGPGKDALSVYRETA